MRKCFYVGKSTFQSDRTDASRAFSSHAGKRNDPLFLEGTPPRRAAFISRVLPLLVQSDTPIGTISRF